jgi:hypothetical protein
VVTRRKFDPEATLDLSTGTKPPVCAWCR